MEQQPKTRPTTGPYSSERAHLSYIAKEYQAVQALADDDPKALAYLAKLARILDRAARRETNAAQ